MTLRDPQGPALQAPALALAPRARSRASSNWVVRAVVPSALAMMALAWAGCGSSSSYYCDNTGCFQCDGYGCSALTPPAKTPCTGNASCASGSVCTANGCSVVCADDTVCPQGEVCKGGYCLAPSSTGTTPKECTTKSDCGSGKACVNATCQACGGAAGPCACTTKSDCDGTGECVAGLCTEAQNTCKFSSECGDNKVCADGQCLASCGGATGCDAGFSCEGGVCKPTAPNGACTTDTQCAAETPKCVAGSCAKSCTADGECGTGKYCNQGACVVDTRPKPNCTADAQCGGSAATPKKCLDGFCKYTCTSSDYCRTIDTRIGYCAADGVCRTAAEANAECTQSAQCGAGKSCIDNKCK